MSVTVLPPTGPSPVYKTDDDGNLILDRDNKPIIDHYKICFWLKNDGDSDEKVNLDVEVDKSGYPVASRGEKQPVGSQDVDVPKKGPKGPGEKEVCFDLPWAAYHLLNNGGKIVYSGPWETPKRVVEDRN